MDAPADALAEPLEPLQQDQGAQVDDVPVVDDAVDAPAEAPPIEGLSRGAPAARAASEPAPASEPAAPPRA